MPITSIRVNDNAVDVWAQYTDSSAKTSAQATCAPDLPRLFSPRLRLWFTLMQSSMNPMRPNATTAPMAR